MAREPNRLLPDFFIVGQPKSGSTAAYEMLRQHPQIYMPALKEPDFFASDLRPRSVSSVAAPQPQTLSAYLDLFRPAADGQLKGEASVIYLRSRVAASEIARANPRARSVAILREPSQLIRSLHLQLVKTHDETVKDLRKALALEPARSQGRSVPRSARRPALLLYSEHVNYVEQLRRFHTALPRDQLLILIYDDFAQDNTATIRSIFRFLGVDETVPVPRVAANVSSSLRSVRADDALHRLAVSKGKAARGIRATVKRLSTDQMRRQVLDRAYRSLHTTPTPPDDQLAEELRARFAPEVARLSDYLGRDLLSLWGYE